MVGINAIKILIGQAGEGQLRTPRLLAVGLLLAFQIVVQFISVYFGGILHSLFGVTFGPIHFFAFGPFRLTLVFLLILVLIARLVIFFLILFRLIRILAQLVSHIERSDQLARHAGECRLVVQRVHQMVKLGTRLFLNPGTPKVNELASMRGRGIAGETLTHHQGQRLLDRRVLAVGQPGKGLFLIAILEHGAEVVRHPRHQACADRLYTRLLDRFKDRPRIAPFRLVFGMYARVVIGEPQGKGIGNPASNRHFVLRKVEAQLRQLGAVTVKARRVGAKCDVELGLIGDGFHGDRQRPFERGRGAFTILRHVPSLLAWAHEIDTCAVDSGNSSPKQR